MVLPWPRRAALRTRVVLSLAAAASLLLAVFFFFAHNRSCVNYRYTWFALGEWLFVLFNIIFHYEGEMRELAHVDIAWTFGRPTDMQSRKPGGTLS